MSRKQRNENNQEENRKDDTPTMISVIMSKFSDYSPGGIMVGSVFIFPKNTIKLPNASKILEELNSLDIKWLNRWKCDKFVIET